MHRLVLLSLVLIAGTAHAHDGPHGSFAAAFAHPFFGWDHLLAMLLVGMLTVQQRWLPVAFVGGAAAGVLSGALLPGGEVIESLILASVLVLGAAVLLQRYRMPRLLLALCVVFGFAHGAAHGIELRGNVVEIAGGMLLATALLHGVGYLLVRVLTSGAWRRA